MRALPAAVLLFFWSAGLHAARPAKPAPEPKASPLFFEPFVLESPRVPPHRYRLDMRLGLGLDKFHPKGISSDVLSQSYGRLCATADARFAPSRAMELAVALPVVLQTISFNGSAGDAVKGDTSAGPGQAEVRVKLPVSRRAALRLWTELPTGDAGDFPPQGEGTNFGFQALVRRGAFHAGAGRVVKTAYDRHFPARGFRRDPGDVTMLSLALVSRDGPAGEDKVVGGVLEANAYFVERDRSNGVLIKGGGLAAHLLGGFMLGHHRLRSTALTKMALAVSLGDEDMQSFDLQRGVGDFTLILSHELRWGDSAP